ncbi:MAG: LOG family protein [Phycisphaerae bacterium]|nr:LOG family protein [Phycisphaerae bacterium]
MESSSDFLENVAEAEQPGPASGTDEARRRARNQAIAEFVRGYAPSPDADLLESILVTVCRLAADGADRGDLKILNTALKELRFAFKVFAPYKEIPKVTIFGSARTPQEHPQYQQALRFADLIQQQGWMVITGAGGGIMQAGHHGATRDKSFGVAISLPFEQKTNDVIADDQKLINFKYFFTRKLLFIKEAAAVVLFPGGFGTQDEGYESLTLVQTLKSSPIPIIMCDEPGGTYWRNWERHLESELLNNGMIDPEDLGLFFVTDSAEGAVEEILNYYRRYHSSRYVGDDLVIRLQEPLSDEQVRRLDRDFADILIDGSYQQLPEALPEENGEYPDKARLVFKFHRRSAGRLRQLINHLNALP